MTRRMTLAFSMSILLSAAAVAQDAALPAPVRRATVNLSVEKPDDKPTVKLKTKSGEIIAESPQDEKLEYEVVISSPVGDVVVYFPVPKDSPVYMSYHTNSDDPQKILETLRLTVGEPVVRVLAVRDQNVMAAYHGTNRSRVYQFPSAWRPVYQVSLPESSDPTPRIVAVSEDDTEVHDIMNQVVPNNVPRGDVAEVMHISGQRSTDKLASRR